jgi:hypothetical protein
LAGAGEAAKEMGAIKASRATDPRNCIFIRPDWQRELLKNKPDVSSGIFATRISDD